MSEKVKERQLRRQRELGAIFEGHRRGVGAGLAVSKEVVRTWAEMTAEEVRLEEEERRQKGEMERRWTEVRANGGKNAWRERESTSRGGGE